MSAAPPAAPRSAVYEGTVTHRRAEPGHRFTTRVALPLLFLDEMAEMRAIHPLVDLDPSPHRRTRLSAMRFNRSDYLPSASPTLQGAVEETVAPGRLGARTGRDAWPRPYLGLAVQPADHLLLLDPAGLVVEWTVLEVSNTPWHERCRYVVGPPGEHRFAKAMHVSPFLPAQGAYTLRYSPPSEVLRVDLDVEAPEAPASHRRWGEPTSQQRPEVQLAATMLLRRRQPDRAALSRLLWSYFLMTVRVSAGIYVQALRLGALRAHFHPHPRRRDSVTACPSTPKLPAAALESARD